MPQINLKLGRFGVHAGIDKSGLSFKMGGLPMGTSVAGGRQGGAGRGWFFGGLLPGADVDYNRKAGDKWKNTIVAASLSWIGRNAPQAPPCVYREKDNGEEEIVPKHPLTKVLRRPNKFYDGRTLRQATYLSLIAGGGNAYWWVKRDNIGRPLEFWWLPHWDCWPLWNNDSTTDNWILGYGYRSNGITYQLDEREVIHFRDSLDPENQRSGIDHLKAASRELVTDNDASGFVAQLLGNMCIPGAIISPVGGAQFEQADATEFKANFEENSGGENRFRPMVLSSEVRVDKLTFSPEEMALHTMQDRPEATTCAIIGVHPAVLGLLVGLDKGMAYASMENAERGSWYNGIIPRDMLIGSELDTQVLAYYPDSEGMRVGYDYRKVPALQENLAEKNKWIAVAVGGPYISPNEARQLNGMKAIAGGEELVQPVVPAAGAGKDGDVSEKSVLKMIAAGWRA